MRGWNISHIFRFDSICMYVDYACMCVSAGVCVDGLMGGWWMGGLRSHLPRITHHRPAISEGEPTGDELVQLLDGAITFCV